GQKDLNTVCRLILSELAPVVSAQHAVFYVVDASAQPAELVLLASYAYEGKAAHDSRLGLGEGLIGQCALEKRQILLTNIPIDYIRISSGLGSAPPRNILVLPVVFEGQVKGVLELASFDGFNNAHKAFLEQLTESIGIVINTIWANTRTEDLLKQSQSLARELQSRQEELQQTNQELQEKAQLLAHQNQEVERKNQEVEQARQALEEKASQLALTSKYKSEFLANMSHELRTPLNSLLILSDQLCINPERNLTLKQVEFAKTIHSAGNDLLMLINDILDLSKIESGTVAVDIGELRLDELQHYVERTFRHVAEAKHVEFFINLDPRLPRSMFTDSKRLQQIIKNLLSNAFKFTHHGEVTLIIEQAASGWNPENDDLNRATEVLAFSVIDTGIGISPDKQQIIFEAFQQADGSTSRKYGGTGLGLAISRELSRLLRGEIRLKSSPGRGSAFTLYLPRAYSAPSATRKSNEAAAEANAAIEKAKLTNTLPSANAANWIDPYFPVNALAPSTDTPVLVNEAHDDRDRIQLDDAVILIVENDLAFARFLLDTAREKGLKGLVTSLGAAALALAKEYQPSAITLDIFLPDIEGWRVLSRLKNDLSTRHIPVTVVSTEEARERAIMYGAHSFVAKPIQSKDTLDDLLAEVKEYADQTVRNVLLVTPDEKKRKSIERYIDGAEDIQIFNVSDGKAAMETLRERPIDCIILDAHITDFVPEQLPQDIRAGYLSPNLPIILYGDESQISNQSAPWNALSKSAMVRWAHSPERLVDQATLFLHREVTKLPERQRQILHDIYESNKPLHGKKVLIVDDDIRNIFALTTVLEDYGMNILSADNGRDAITLVQGETDIDVVLMDIMMPELDGIDTMREIRKIPACKSLPIIAVTAKAMKGDRDRCIEAGAWDYLSKPVDSEHLLSVLRAWLQR
ncbi:MAG TPA: response regulator, partial [Burkholderiales bacterium]|nr:response regulator [Burkholderiales bacterium]